MLPNDTDLTAFRETADIPGFNFAFIDDHFDYHTVQDNFENFTPESLEHQATYLMPLLTHFSNADLSNFAVRPFKEDGDISITYNQDTNKELIFNTVEGAFQAYKIFYSDAYNDPNGYKNYSKEGIELLEKLSKATGSQAKSIGRTIKGLDVKGWDNNSDEIMKDLLIASFDQNPKALERLLSTGNAELTHTQDKGKWGKEFPRLLMEVRKELSNLKPVNLPKATQSNIDKVLNDLITTYRNLSTADKVKLKYSKEINDGKGLQNEAQFRIFVKSTLENFINKSPNTKVEDAKNNLIETLNKCFK
jgi:predicted NAD-dependent protein-ADP-ribosyltransferase YbiA (DUF1768 family)